MSTLALAAVGGLGWESGITLSANHFLALVSSGESSEGRLDLDASETASTESEHEMESGLLLDVVVRKSSSVLELLTGEDESLLIGRDALLVLDFGSEKQIS
jgi:hypothetical protein